jgi:prevent-host-death family protein
MTKVEATEARKEFAKTLREARHGGRVVIMRRGKPAAAMVSIGDLRLLRMIEARQDELDGVEIRKAKAEIAQQGAIPWDQIKAELGL